MHRTNDKLVKNLQEVEYNYICHCNVYMYTELFRVWFPVGTELFESVALGLPYSPLWDNISKQIISVYQ